MPNCTSGNKPCGQRCIPQRQSCLKTKEADLSNSSNALSLGSVLAVVAGSAIEHHATHVKKRLPTAKEEKIAAGLKLAGYGLTGLGLIQGVRAAKLRRQIIEAENNGVKNRNLDSAYPSAIVAEDWPISRSQIMNDYRSDSYHEMKALLQERIDSIKEQIREDKNCGQGTKACGGACIPENYNCKAAGAAVAGGALAGAAVVGGAALARRRVMMPKGAGNMARAVGGGIAHNGNRAAMAGASGLGTAAGKAQNLGNAIAKRAKSFAANPRQGINNAATRTATGLGKASGNAIYAAGKVKTAGASALGTARGTATRLNRQYSPSSRVMLPQGAGNIASAVGGAVQQKVVRPVKKAGLRAINAPKRAIKTRFMM